MIKKYVLFESQGYKIVGYVYQEKGKMKIRKEWYSPKPDKLLATLDLKCLKVLALKILYDLESCDG